MAPSSRCPKAAAPETTGLQATGPKRRRPTPLEEGAVDLDRAQLSSELGRLVRSSFARISSPKVVADSGAWSSKV